MDFMFLVFAALVCVVGLSSAAVHVDSKVSKENVTGAIISRLLAPHRASTSPYAREHPIKVKIDIYVQGFGRLDEVNMVHANSDQKFTIDFVSIQAFSVEIFLRQEWHHPALAFNELPEDLLIPMKHVGQLWMPDLFFPNGITSSFHDILQRNGIVRIQPNGTVSSSTRLTLRLHCQMLLHHYPFDHQECSIEISTYAFTNDTMILQWRDDDAIEVNELDLPQFELVAIHQDRCSQAYKTGHFDCLEARFRFRRLVGYYLLQNYLPCVLIVMLSWVSFWISRDSVAARISLGVTTILTLTTQAIDTWYTISNVFVFAALLEFMAVNVLTRQENEIAEEQVRLEDEDEDHTADATPNAGCQQRLTARDVDVTSRVLFPGLYVVVSVAYWAYYIRK
ncbi:hypothetical protein CAPTEDRAFT_200824 [Capitella teleta]|uniref:Neurotransmitter-gated ion-channel ligand-binding domain-containing protein n=1 Tax=Capitella teleta TaxID=283909 RepID=R7UW02_CAPTE|nr:hypothetical protein CAPTEDRAFT_200824 [Capitella teleta]|eukprot:ELU10509.1 hypothetical protein CAPTEDRAFT_200824 [Capitella teleta]